MKYLLDFQALTTRQLTGFILICICFATYLYFMIFVYRSAKPELKEEMVKLATNARVQRRRNIVGGANRMAANMQYIQGKISDTDLTGANNSTAQSGSQKSSPSGNTSRVRQRTKSVIDVMLSKELLALDEDESQNLWEMDRNLAEEEDMQRPTDVEEGSTIRRSSSRRASMEFMLMNWNEVEKDPEDEAAADDDEEEDGDDSDDHEMQITLTRDNTNKQQNSTGITADNRGGSPVDARLKRLSGRRGSLSAGFVNEIDDLLKGKDGLLNEKRPTTLLSKLFGALSEEEVRVIDDAGDSNGAAGSPGARTSIPFGTSLFSDASDNNGSYQEEWERAAPRAPSPVAPAPGLMKTISFEKTSREGGRRVSFMMPLSASPREIINPVGLAPGAQDADNNELSELSLSREGQSRPSPTDFGVTSSDLLDNPMTASNITSIVLCGQAFDIDMLALLGKLICMKVSSPLILLWYNINCSEITGAAGDAHKRVGTTQLRTARFRGGFDWPGSDRKRGK
jgi:hypothetical protein